MGVIAHAITNVPNVDARAAATGQAIPNGSLLNVKRLMVASVEHLLRPGVDRRENVANLTEAIRLAARLHDGQLDKAGKPYILHPLHVMSKMDTDLERIVAVLHDVVEDCGITVTQVGLYYGFSAESLAAIDALSRRKDEEYDAYIQRLSGNALAVKVKMADLQHNLDESRGVELDVSLKKRYRKALNYLAEKDIA